MRTQHGKPHGVVSNDTTGQAGRLGVAERFVVPLRPGNSGRGQGPQFKTDAIRREGPWRLGNLSTPINGQKLMRLAASRTNAAHQFTNRPLMISVHLHARMHVASCWRRVHHRDRHRHTIPIALAALPGATLPRLRALALFGRRPPQRVDSLVMPASENLHRNGRSSPLKIIANRTVCPTRIVINSIQTVLGIGYSFGFGM
jgi:hypothetical protein